MDKHDERQRVQDVQKYSSHIEYSTRYSDDVWEYRHVVLPRELVKYVPKSELMAETEWRSLGVQQSLGWLVIM